MGGGNPVRIQSMTSVSTMDTQACVEQCIRILDAGGELVRLTARNIKEAENLRNIKTELRKRGYDMPLSADVHFNPDIAETAARITCSSRRFVWTLRHSLLYNVHRVGQRQTRTINKFAIWFAGEVVRAAISAEKSAAVSSLRHRW